MIAFIKVAKFDANRSVFKLLKLISESTQIIRRGTSTI